MDSALAGGQGIVLVPNANPGGVQVHAHYEVKIALETDEDSLMDVSAAYLAASDLLEEYGHARRQGPMVLQAVIPCQPCVFCQAAAE